MNKSSKNLCLVLLHKKNEEELPVKILNATFAFCAHCFKAVDEIWKTEQVIRKATLTKAEHLCVIEEKIRNGTKGLGSSVLREIIIEGVPNLFTVV